MIRQLPAIKQAIETLVADAEEQSTPTRWAHFQTAMTIIEQRLYAQFKENPDRIAVWDAQNFHADLVRLIDGYTPITGERKLPAMLNRLLGTLHFCEQKFQVPIDMKANVPVVYEMQVQHEIREREPIIVQALTHKQVNPVLIGKISHGFQLLLSQPAGSMDYGTYRYFQLILPALHELSTSALRKDWTLRLFRFFIQYNYNHMGIYNWWERETAQMLARKNSAEELEQLHKLANLIEHIDQKTTLGYEAWRAPLKAQLLAYLERRKALLADRKLLQEVLEDRQLIVNIPIDEHNIHFNEDFDAGIYSAYPSKKEASEAYVKAVRGPDGVLLSAHSLRKADTTKYYGAADRVEEKLSEKREGLIQRFGLLLSSRKNSRKSMP